MEDFLIINEFSNAKRTFTTVQERVDSSNEHCNHVTFEDLFKASKFVDKPKPIGLRNLIKERVLMGKITIGSQENLLI